MASVIFFPRAAPPIAPLAAIATGVKSISLLESVSIESSLSSLPDLASALVARLSL
jgi:hypothetical protein